MSAWWTDSSVKWNYLFFSGSQDAPKAASSVAPLLGPYARAEVALFS